MTHSSTEVTFFGDIIERTHSELHCFIVVLSWACHLRQFSPISFHYLCLFHGAVYWQYIFHKFSICSLESRLAHCSASYLLTFMKTKLKPWNSFSVLLLLVTFFRTVAMKIYHVIYTDVPVPVPATLHRASYVGMLGILYLLCPIKKRSDIQIVCRTMLTGIYNYCESHIKLLFLGQCKKRMGSFVPST